MAFLSINGIDLSSYLRIQGTKRPEPILVGENRRAFDGSIRRDVLARKPRWRFRTKPLTQQESDAIVNLVEGLGDVLAMEDRYTSKGFFVFDFDGGDVYAAGKYGNALNWMDPDPAHYIEYDSPILVGSPSIWGWRYNGATWDHYIRRYSDNACWKNGVTLALGSWPVDVTVDTSLGRIRFTGDTATPFDDWVIFPSAIPTTWAADIYAEHNARAWTAGPKRRVTGDAMPGAVARTMRGEVVDRRFSPAVSSGAFTTNLEELEFVLEDF
jgi:hypothetical protein